MKISIIIPVFNLEKFIESCIESILQQSYRNFEIIIINDGSTDDSLKICEKYANEDNRIRLFTTENRGLSAARNKGVELVKGEYFIFVDGDDFIRQGLLQKIAETIEHIEETDIVKFGYVLYDDRTKVYKNGEEVIEKGEYTGEEFLEKILSANQIYHWYSWIYAYRTRYYRGQEFEFVKGIHYEDIEHTFRTILPAKKICVILEDGYVYRINREGSITEKSRIQDELDRQQVVKDNVQFIQNATKGSLKELLLNNMFIESMSSMNVLYQHKKNGFDELLRAIEENLWLGKYAKGKRYKILIKLIHIFGIRVTAYILHIRAKIKKLN